MGSSSSHPTFLSQEWKYVQDAQPEAKDLTVMTFNLCAPTYLEYHSKHYQHVPQVLSWPSRLKQILQQIQKHAPHVAGFQEVGVTNHATTIIFSRCGFRLNTWFGQIQQPRKEIGLI